jgi:predicted DsbA family dithiol-disulfide isomerase
LNLKLPPVQPRSRKAFETAAFARERGAFDAVHEALLRAFFENGRDLADVEVLAAVVADAGLDADELREALASGSYTQQVIEDQRHAQRLGVTGVPAMLFHGPDERKVLINGAQSYAALKRQVDEMLHAGAGAE